MLTPYRTKAEYAANNIWTIPQIKTIKNLCLDRVFLVSYLAQKYIKKLKSKLEQLLFHPVDVPTFEHIRLKNICND